MRVAVFRGLFRTFHIGKRCIRCLVAEAISPTTDLSTHKYQIQRYLGSRRLLQLSDQPHG